MMLEFLGWKPEAATLRTAVRAALRENYVTPDLGGDKRTVEVAIGSPSIHRGPRKATLSFWASSTARWPIRSAPAALPLFAMSCPFQFQIAS